ncbi:Major facilitator superfamily (MFS_1) transporter [Kutzneria albida DSM 43870]|uniref:Major facilitator superfamily (MFS_1) transporter n=1 Tax=Kutzneria albida DSM 43870 TaxID=1449976 RepID=W5W935_9PSEU|nr:Major facilitator superfamily (MFS_1) transporter [Kutzneria albida DSM 43870]
MQPNSDDKQWEYTGVINEASRKWWVLTGVSIVSFLGCIDLTIVNTAAPDIGRDLRTTVTQMQLIVNIFVVALSMFMVTAGRLSDILGRRKVLYAGTALFGLASLGAGLAPNIPLLVVFRFLQGASCAVLYTSSSTIVSNAFPESQRGKAIGTLFAVNGIGLAIGPMLGGLIVGALNWHWVFLVNVPLVVIALAICSVSLTESKADTDVELDWPGLVLLALGLSGVIFAFTFNDTFGWGSWQVLGTLAVGVLALVVFVIVDRRQRFPLIPFKLLANKLFLSAVTAEFSLAFFYTTALFLMPLYLSTVRHYDELTIGLMMLPTTATVAVLSPLVGRLVDKVGPIIVLTTGFAAFTLSAVLQSQFDAHSGIGYVAAAFVLMGIGWAFVLGPAAVAALSAVPQRLSGLAVGATWTFHNFGGAVGLALGMTLFRGFGESALRGGLATQGATAGPWTAEVVAKPGSAADLLQQHAGLGQPAAGDLVDSLFAAGDRAAMLLLVGTSLVAMVTIFVLGRLRGRDQGQVAETAQEEPADLPAS